MNILKYKQSNIIMQFGIYDIYTITVFVSEKM